MKKYVIWVSKNGVKLYFKTSDGSVKYVSDPHEATIFPNRVLAQCVFSAVKSAIKKNGLSVDVFMEAV